MSSAGYHHVGLAVSNLDASIKFFETIGFKKIVEDPAYPEVHLLDSNSTLISLFKTDDDAKPFDRRKNVGLHHLAIKMPSSEAVTEAYEAVMKIPGVKSDFEPRDQKGAPIRHAMVFEPSGTRIEFAYQLHPF
jgi:catechol 2,3-dioxygenase-like lactoylglutathione lyase family enzyme